MTILFLLMLLWTVVGSEQKYSDGGFCPGRFLALANRCYWFSTDSVSAWDTAMDKCNQRDSFLANIETDYESFLVNHYIRENNLTNATYWVGGSNRAGGDWEWAGTGMVMEHRNWCYNQPNNEGGHENCVVLLQVQYQLCWNDTECEKQSDSFYYICERGFV